MRRTKRKQATQRRLGERETRAFEAEAVAKKLDGETVVILRQAGEGGQLYGSVSTRDIAGALGEAGFKVERNQIVLNIPIKSIGMHKMPVELHGEVEVEIIVNVARNADEAVRQARGEDLSVTRSGNTISYGFSSAPTSGAGSVYSRPGCSGATEIVTSKITPCAPSAPMNRWRRSGPLALRGAVRTV